MTAATRVRPGRQPVSLNRYTYAGNNPLRYFDPDGRRFIATGSVDEETVEQRAMSHEDSRLRNRGEKVTAKKLNAAAKTARQEHDLTIAIQDARGQWRGDVARVLGSDAPDDPFGIVDPSAYFDYWQLQATLDDMAALAAVPAHCTGDAAMLDTSCISAQMRADSHQDNDWLAAQRDLALARAVGASDKRIQVLQHRVGSLSPEWLLTVGGLGMGVGARGRGLAAGRGASLADDVAGRASAHSVADFARLARQLQFEEAASVFTRSGRLTASVIRDAQVVTRGSQLRNPQVIKTLTADGSRIADWAKYRTSSFQSPSGPFQVHFYRNSVTGVTNYGIDYKVKFLGVR